MDLEKVGSNTARNGFRNEDVVQDKFNNWHADIEATKWIEIMGYSIEGIKEIEAVKPAGNPKTDVSVTITTVNSKKHENISIKLVSNPKGFNQIDKRRVRNYKKFWNFSNIIEELLYLFTGEISPIRIGRDHRRMFFDEFNRNQQQLIVEWFRRNKNQIINDIIRGRGDHAANWMLVAQRLNSNARWVLKAINEVINFFPNGNVSISPRGSLRLGKITMQRKGGDNGRETANMLQFKINPAELFDS